MNNEITTVPNNLREEQVKYETWLATSRKPVTTTQYDRETGKITVVSGFIGYVDGTAVDFDENRKHLLRRLYKNYGVTHNTKNPYKATHIGE